MKELLFYTVLSKRNTKKRLKETGYLKKVSKGVYAEKDKEKRLLLQNKAKTLLSMLDYFAGIAFEQDCILFKQYEQIAKQQAECLLYLNKWIASTTKMVSTN